MPNGEKVKREWLIYSEKLDAVHCFCCYLFDNADTGPLSSLNGYEDWKNLARTMKIHETSQKHLKNYADWKIVSNQISNQKTVDKHLLSQMQAEKERLREVFKRFISLILYFARQNIAFTGSSSNINDPMGKNGNFIQLIHTLSEFDPILKEHLEKSTHVHYLSPKIQNELIALIASQAKSQIINDVKKSKYFSIIADTTPDVSRSEQMTLILRYVFLNEETDIYEIKETFVGYVQIFDKTGAGISQAIENEIKALGLDLENLRGQAYDNGSNMKGKDIGVQKRILDKYPRALYNPCASHSLNLLVNDAADSTLPAIDFFSLVHHIFVFLSGSTGRWDVLHRHLQTPSHLTPKPICATRWSSRIDAMKPLSKNAHKIVDALKEIHDSERFDAKTRHAAICIIDKIDFAFLCCVNVWHDILFQVNIASQALQSVSSTVQTATVALQNLLNYLENYERVDLTDAIERAKEMAEKIEIVDDFVDVRRTTKANRYRASLEGFKSDFVRHIIEVSNESAENRFKALQKFHELFSFLYDFENFESNKENSNLKTACTRLADALTSDQHLDIDGEDLFCEMPVIATLLKEHNFQYKHALDILNFIKKNKLENSVPNMMIAYRIMLSTPVSVASGERSFSKLKIIKSYLRNSMNQDRLNSLAIISIENDVAKNINYDDIIETFASAKSRKRKLT